MSDIEGMDYSSIVHQPLIGDIVKVSWRTLPTVLTKEELLDKAYARARKAADRVDDSDRVFRVRKQLSRMLQTASDIYDISYGYGKSMAVLRSSLNLTFL